MVKIAIAGEMSHPSEMFYGSDTAPQLHTAGICVAVLSNCSRLSSLSMHVFSRIYNLFAAGCENCRIHGTSAKSHQSAPDESVDRRRLPISKRFKVPSREWNLLRRITNLFSTASSAADARQRWLIGFAPFLFQLSVAAKL